MAESDGAAKKPGNDGSETLAGGTAAVVASAAPAPAASKKKNRLGAFMHMSSHLVVVLLVLYALWVAYIFYGIAYPAFPDIHPGSGAPVVKYRNVFQPGDRLRARLWVGARTSTPIAEIECAYSDREHFERLSQKVEVVVTDRQLMARVIPKLLVDVTHLATNVTVRAQGGLLKSVPTPNRLPLFNMVNGSVCPFAPEPGFGNKMTIARGIPRMQVRLVFDTTRYPSWVHRTNYVPALFVDEFWLTNDQLVKLNVSGTNTFVSEVRFGLMSSARWRFQSHMEESFALTANVFGEESEELLQVRDLFANTNAYLLVTTLIVSVLHMIFEFLAFRSDVQFFQGCDPSMLNKYVSVQSIVVGIFMQILLCMYLWDESANLIVLGTSLVSVLIDVWKVQRAMTFKWVLVLGVVPVPALVSRVAKQKADDFDSIAMRWLALILAPFVIVYSFYSLYFHCYKGWSSYFLSLSASCVYSLGFVLMTPQVFINYKHKSVSYLPWRKFMYRAITTFIDDLFAFIIRMPTMHRLSCFRDDIVFFVYLYQRHLYPVDKSRTFDEDGYQVVDPDGSAAKAKTE